MSEPQIYEGIVKKIKKENNELKQTLEKIKELDKKWYLNDKDFKYELWKILRGDTNVKD